MGKVLLLLLLTVGTLVAITLYVCPCFYKEIKVPEIASHKWWGPGNGPADAANAKIVSRPFQIKVEDSVLQDLQRRLQNTRLSSPLEGVAFQYGMNTDHLKTILDYWQNKYDWKKEEAKLNQLPQFLAKIEGIDVHYVHVKPPSNNKVKVLPLLMIHGWPGSFVEFYKIIPLLTSGVTGVAFEVICPSIPGYGFSEAPHHPGFSAVEAARVFSKLMHSLGHQKFYLQGGDWGSLIATIMSIIYPERVYGLHLNMALPKHNSVTLVKYIAGLVAPSLMFEKNEKFNVYPPGELVSNMLLETGYMHIQATKPDTVGVGLSDSPAGLAAYILEKFSSWTDYENREKKDGGLLKKFSLDELLTNVMVYWVTNSITSSTRFYKENVNPTIMKLNFDLLPVLVPTGIATLPNELLSLPCTMLQPKYPQMLTCNYLERGGHFAAMEEPRLLADDIRAFVTASEALLEEQRREAQKKEAEKKEL